MPESPDMTADTTFSPERERELLAHCQAGQEAAFDALVEAVKRPAYALAYRWTRDQAFAYDVLQEALIRLYEQIPRWDYSCRVQTWLYRVVTNACIDAHRGKQTEPLRELAANRDGSVADPIAHLPDPSPSPSERLEKAETAHQLEQCLRRLPRNMQHIVRLRYLCGLSLQEISHVQSCSLGTVKATIFQGLRKLRLELARSTGGQS